MNRLPSLGHEIGLDLFVAAHRSPSRPTNSSASPGASPQSSPKTRQHQTAGNRFAFTNRLANKFYQDNTIMGATNKTVRQKKTIAAKASALDTELERLHNEIAEVRQLEKQARAIQEQHRVYVLGVHNAAAASIQRCYRLFRILHHRARRKKRANAAVLQKLLGGSTGRTYAKDATNRMNAELLQAVLGGSLTGLDPVAYQTYNRESYAKDLQRWWRWILQVERDRKALWDKSALMLQRVYRGNLGRRRATKLAEISARKELLGMALSGIGRVTGGGKKKR